MPTKSEIVNLVEAQSATLEDLSKRLSKLENQADKQDSKLFTVIIGALVAVVLIVASVAIEVILSNKNDVSNNNLLMQQISELKVSQAQLVARQSELENKISETISSLNNIRLKNPYLK